VLVFGLLLINLRVQRRCTYLSRAAQDLITISTDYWATKMRAIYSKTEKGN
jgi:hypothetical protein